MLKYAYYFNYIINSYQEMAMIDMPAITDYILQNTEQPSMIYIGHSMGTTISYAFLSTKLDYNEKIKMVISLSPVVYWKYEIKVPFLSVITRFDNLLKVIYI